MKCRKCGVRMPLQQGPGRKRTMCLDCSPKDKRDRHVRSVTTLPAPQLAETGDLLEATKSALAAREESPVGALALFLAAQLDQGQHTGSQAAALAREFRAAIDAATRGGAGSSALDELRARRAARRGA